VLPGNQSNWPVDIEVNGKPHAVIGRGGTPSLHLAPGLYTVIGKFSWSGLPESLTIPADTGIVRLTVHGEPIKSPRIDKQGSIWLGRTEGRGSDADKGIKNSHTVTVQRRIIDEIPLQVRTRIELDVTGEQRELILGRPLLDGFIPIGITSPLPARIEPNGELRVQLRAGRHVIEVQELRWYADRVSAEPPNASVLSVPILVYRLLMLGWALWLAFAILRWLRWGWSCFATDGLWRRWRKPKEVVA
jgi:hypothetical protein